MKKLILNFLPIFLFSSLLFACEKEAKHNKIANDKRNDNSEKTTFTNDSIALLKLTKTLYDWTENKSRIEDFPTLQNKMTDSVYSGIDFKKHQSRIQELKESKLFSEQFIINYNRIANSIDAALQKKTIVYNVGELPPYGNDANPWCNCQDVPDGFLNKIWIMNLSIEGHNASYNWSWGDGLVYHITAIKEDNSWKIATMEGFDYNSYVGTFQKDDDFTGSWQNGTVVITVGDTFLNFEYHGQCMYAYPIRKISETEFEMIWARDMDCKFDNGTDKKFGLKNVPVIGKAFAKFSLKNKILSADYYYKDWVQKYSHEVQAGVFTSEFERKIQE